MNYTQIVKEKFLKLTEEQSMLDCSSVVVGFSGGPDSVALLTLLQSYCRDKSIFLHACHIHHGIRGEQADRDALFCQEFCFQRAIPFHLVKFNIPILAQQEKAGLEETARKYRYSAFQKLCQEEHIERIAVAHHADDNLETLLFHLIRGSSLSGACGIHPIRENIIRPLLLCTKEELAGYLSENQLPYVLDSTNKDTNYTRNYIRHQIIPCMRKINPEVTTATTRFCESVRLDHFYLEKEAEKYVTCDDCTLLSHLEDAILRRVLEKKYFLFSGQKILERERLLELCNLVKKAKPSKICLPCQVTAYREQNRLLFMPTYRVPKSENSPFYCRRLHMGCNEIPESDSLLYIWNQPEEHEEKSIKEKQIIYKLFIHRTFDSVTINTDDLYVRCRQEGDCIRYGGMSRSLKKLFCDHKIPKEERNVLPIVTDSQGILWVPGFPPRDHTAPLDHSIIHFYYFSKKKN
jgi:tRNA(Ile)-lysidine synthase